MACDCVCHLPGVVSMHIVPCCDPEQLPIFVYGSLKKGGHLHDEISHYVDAVEPASTWGYQVDTQAWFPGARFDVPREEIQGEILHLNPEWYELALDHFDYIEGVPHLYLRERIALEDGREAWTYAFQGLPPR